MSQPLHHLGVILDGNGRWAQKRFFPRHFGHHQGTKRVDDLISWVLNIKIPYLSLYAFSTENWKRSETEIKFIMGLINYIIDQRTELYVKEKIQFVTQGQIHLLPETTQKKIKIITKKTRCSYPRLTLNISLSYGGREEILRATQALCKKIVHKKLQIDEINEEIFEQHLYQPNIPSLDLIIRTGGEKRISNFMLWQAAYSEIYFSETLWPDFSREEFFGALSWYQTRSRKFGADSSSHRETSI